MEAISIARTESQHPACRWDAPRASTSLDAPASGSGTAQAGYGRFNDNTGIGRQMAY